MGYKNSNLHAKAKRSKQDGRFREISKDFSE